MYFHDHPHNQRFKLFKVYTCTAVGVCNGCRRSFIFEPREMIRRVVVTFVPPCFEYMGLGQVSRIPVFRYASLIHRGHWRIMFCRRFNAQRIMNSRFRNRICQTKEPFQNGDGKQLRYEENPLAIQGDYTSHRDEITKNVMG